MLTRGACLRTILDVADRHRAAIFIGNGFNPRALNAISDRPETFYMMGSMGLALPLSIGFSRFARVPTLAVEGDGNALMGLPAMALARSAGRPLMHVVLDNQRYESTGGQASPAPGFSFGKAAEAAQYSLTSEVDHEDDLAAVLDLAVAGAHLCLVHAHTEPDTAAPPPRLPFHPAEITERFKAAFEDLVRR